VKNLNKKIEGTQPKLLTILALIICIVMLTPCHVYKTTLK